MADLSITAASVVAGTNAVKENGVAGATVTAGQAVYKDASDSGKFKLADNDSATAAVRSFYGIALHGAANGQPLTVLKEGPITIGATTAIGVVYCLSSTAGGICPSADIATGDYNTIIGIGTSTTVIEVQPLAAGAAMA
jgi:hypothetical protein